MPGYCLNLGWPQKNVWRCPDRPPSIHYQWLFGLLMQPSSEWPAGRWLSRQPLSCLFLYASQGRHSCHVTRGSNGNPLGNVSTCNGLSVVVCVGSRRGGVYVGNCQLQNVEWKQKPLTCAAKRRAPFQSRYRLMYMKCRSTEHQTCWAGLDIMTLLNPKNWSHLGQVTQVAKGTGMPGTLTNALKW